MEPPISTRVTIGVMSVIDRQLGGGGLFFAEQGREPSAKFGSLGVSNGLEPSALDGVDHSLGVWGVRQE